MVHQLILLKLVRNNVILQKELHEAGLKLWFMVDQFEFKDTRIEFVINNFSS